MGEKIRDRIFCDRLSIDDEPLTEPELRRLAEQIRAGRGAAELELSMALELADELTTFATIVKSMLLARQARDARREGGVVV